MEILKKTSGERDALYSRIGTWAIRYLHRARYFPIFLPRLRQHCHFAAARRRPRKTKSAPAIRLSHCPIVSFRCNRSPKAEPNRARTRHQIVPVVTNVKPRIRNARTLLLDAGSMNCGRKARKNSATFGFRMLVRTSCRNAALVVRRGKWDGKLKCV